MITFLTQFLIPNFLLRSPPILQAGTFLNATGSTGPCEDCSKGKFLRDPGVDASKHASEADCRSCQRGFYADSVGMAECTSCVAGKYMPEFIDGDPDSEDDCEVRAYCMV